VIRNRLPCWITIANLLFCFCLLNQPGTGVAETIIVDHSHTDITALPEAAILQAKQRLHIAYGHTSHGSQLTTGMTGLIEFANNGGLGLSLPQDIFAFNNGGTSGALDLHDYAMSGDVGYWPQWYNETVAYLDNPANSDVNVIIWSWCGQVDDKYSAGTLLSEYLNPMMSLQALYPDVVFVYMTGHVDIWDDADNKAANQMIRDHVTAHDAVLYDFADIEHYDPDGRYYEYVHDNCNYYDGPMGGSNLLGNWATEWQDTHIEGVDYYNCSSAHSQPLNANLKAYAAWHLWARLGGWDPSGPVAGVDISQTDGSTTVEEGGITDAYDLVLLSQPMDDVEITVTPDAQLNLGGGPGVSQQKTFTRLTWNQPQTITIQAFDDSDKECRHSAVISHTVTSSDPGYHGIFVRAVDVTIVDDDKKSCLLMGYIPVLISSQAVQD